MMADWAPKRFWTETHVDPVDDGFGIRLDARTLNTPSRSPLIVPTAELARAIAEEWEAQTDKVDPATMPMTRMANTAIDRVVAAHDEVAAYIAAYGETDLLCYRADRPAELVQRQADRWNPMLDWATDAYDARLSVTEGVMPVAQDSAALDRLARAVSGQTAFGLTALHDLVTLSGSLVLGLAAARDVRPPQDIWDLSRLDDDWQAEQWGVDDDAAQTAAIKRRAFLDAHRFYRAAQ